MGVYKVIQDIEAEDKLLGPLTLRQFIFAIVGVLFYYLSFLAVSKHVVFLLILFLPIALVATFFAWPFSADQPTEIWALAKLRFYFKPRSRIWDQSGVKNLVTITAPRKVAEPMRSSGMSQGEVNSRLGALASTIDSRGWAIKNVNVNLSTQPGMIGGIDNSDRLLTANNFPQEVPNYEIQASDDILDEQNNPIAQQFDQMITAATKAHRQELVQMMQQPHTSLPAPVSGGAVAVAAPPAPASPERSKLWFMNRPGFRSKPTPVAATQPALASVQASAPTALVAAATPTAEEEALGQQLKAQHDQTNGFDGRMKTIQPLAQASDAGTAALVTTPVPVPDPDPVMPVTTVPANPAIMQLASNNDLNVATLAREAHKQDHPHTGDLHEDEVIISLH